MIICRNIGIQRLLFGYAESVFGFLDNRIVVRSGVWFAGGDGGFLSVFAEAFGGVLDRAGC